MQLEPDKVWAGLAEGWCDRIASGSTTAPRVRRSALVRLATVRALRGAQSARRHKAVITEDGAHKPARMDRRQSLLGEGSGARRCARSMRGRLAWFI